MKRTVNGFDAYNRIITASTPERTDSYTPIMHSNVISQVRKEIGKAGFMITAEDYRSTNNGQVAIGNYRINYKSDPDIELTASFMNSYNKQFAFRFTIGAMVRVCLNGMFVSDGKFGFFKRVHKGDADILSTSIISDYLKSADDYWGTLVGAKDELKTKLLSKSDQYNILGQLFFDDKLLTTLQMNIIKKELENPSFEYGVDNSSAWALYNHVTLALKESHPANWMDDHYAIHDRFAEYLDLGTHRTKYMAELAEKGKTELVFADETDVVSEEEIPVETAGFFL
jgi:hypothetical protein